MGKEVACEAAWLGSLREYDKKNLEEDHMAGEEEISRCKGFENLFLSLSFPHQPLLHPFSLPLLPSLLPSLS